MRFLTIFSISGLLLTLSLGGVAFASPPALRILSAAGQVEAKEGADSEWRQASEGEALGETAILRTGPDSSATVAWSDGNLANLDELTRIQVNELPEETGSKNSALTLTEGMIFAHIEPFGEAGGRFTLSAPTAVAVARGTDFFVALPPSGEAIFGVAHGKILLVQGDVIVPLEESQTAMAGDIIGEPRAMDKEVLAESLGIASRIQRAGPNFEELLKPAPKRWTKEDYEYWDKIDKKKKKELFAEISSDLFEDAYQEDMIDWTPTELLGGLEAIFNVPTD